MMADYRHPMRDLEVRVYERVGGGDFIAAFHPFKTFPMTARGATEREAREKLETFRRESVEKYEAAYQNRMLAREKQRKTRERKKAAAA